MDNMEANSGQAKDASDNEISDLDFYHQDFTTATKWEIFISNLEEIFSNWKLNKVKQRRKLNSNELSTCDWDKQATTVQFKGSNLNAIHYKAKIDDGESDKDFDKVSSEHSTASFVFNDLMDNSNTFCHKPNDHASIAVRVPAIAFWYGLREFVVLSTDEDDLSTSDVKLLQSSIQVAITESSCVVPVFVGLSTAKNWYIGIAEFEVIRLHLDMIYLHSLPFAYKSFTGLRDIFKNKIGNIPDNSSIRFSARHTFLTTEVKKYTEIVTSNSPVLLGSSEFDFIFGVSSDPIKGFELQCIWPECDDRVEILNTFDPLDAPVWMIKSVCDMNIIEQMAEVLDEYLELGNSEMQMLVSGHKRRQNPLNKLTESPLIKLSKIVHVEESKSDQDSLNIGPIPRDVLPKMLYFLFPDADCESSYPYVVQNERLGSDKMKTAHDDSLIHRLSLLLALCNSLFGNTDGVHQLWTEFFMELRYRVDHCIEIPGVQSGFPNLATCLLHQKLQMINICIERRRQRGSKASKELQEDGPVEDNLESDEEFFDCDSNENVLIKPEGRLSRLNDLKLLDSDEYLYIPETQEAVIKTEDELELDADAMLKLGPGSDVSSQMMSIPLHSDMESFKAANPLGKLEDFIRWYSPRDWIENDDDGGGGVDVDRPEAGMDKYRRGRMSDRMQIPGNTWRTVWESAKPVPASKQKQLFDDAKEVEKVMLFIECLKLGDIVQLTFPCLIDRSLIKLSSEIQLFQHLMPAADERLKFIHSLARKISRDRWNLSSRVDNNMLKWKSVVNCVRTLEYDCAKVRSLMEKLNLPMPNADEMALKLNELDEDLIRGLLGLGQPHQCRCTEEGHNQILSLFDADADIKLEQFEKEREYIFRYLRRRRQRNPQAELNRGKRDTSSDGCDAEPQFMRAILKHNDYRICGAFSQNINLSYDDDGTS